MLVLSRRSGEKIVIGDRITITIQRISGSRVNVGIDAPDDVHIVRGELKPLVDAFHHVDLSADTFHTTETTPVPR